MGYPKISGYRRKPKAEKDGGKNYGKPCVVCGVGTVGEKWVQWSFLRGEDETLRVCFEHWKLPEAKLIEAMRNNYY